MKDNLLESIIAIIKDMWKSKSGEINMVRRQPGALCTLRIHTQDAFVLKFGVVLHGEIRLPGFVWVLS